MWKPSRYFWVPASGVHATINIQTQGRGKRPLKSHPWVPTKNLPKDDDMPQDLESLAHNSWFMETMTQYDWCKRTHTAHDALSSSHQELLHCLGLPCSGTLFIIFILWGFDLLRISWVNSPMPNLLLCQGFPPSSSALGLVSAEVPSPVAHATSKQFRKWTILKGFAMWKTSKMRKMYHDWNESNLSTRQHANICT